MKSQPKADPLIAEVTLPAATSELNAKNGVFPESFRSEGLDRLLPVLLSGMNRTWLIFFHNACAPLATVG